MIIDILLIIIMHVIFYILSRVPRTFFIFLIDIYIFTNMYKLSKAYKITKINLKIAYPNRSSDNIELLSRMSLKESLIAGYETIYTWGRETYDSNELLFKVENNFLLKKNINKKKGLICVAYHSRSVDMLLTWLNSQTTTVSLYKEIKYRLLEAFVKKKREINGSISTKTSISGVRKIYKALKENKVICFAADQVPKRGMGKHINFFGKKAYSTTLIQSLACKTESPVIYCSINSSTNGSLYISLKECNNDIYNKSKHLQIINKDIEKMINRRPIDYAWEYKRFKRSLPEDKNLYCNI